MRKLCPECIALFLTVWFVVPCNANSITFPNQDLSLVLRTCDTVYRATLIIEKSKKGASSVTGHGVEGRFVRPIQSLRGELPVATKIMIDERFDWLSIIGDIENDEIMDDVVVFSVGDHFRDIDDATCLPYYIMPVRRDTKVNWNSSLPNILRDIVKPWLDHENPAVKLQAIICGSEVLQAKDLQLITKYRKHDNVWIRAAACAGTLRIGGKPEDCDGVIAATRDLVVMHAESTLVSDEAFPNSASACEAFDFTFQCLRWKQLQFSNYEMSLVMPFCNFLTHQKNGALADFYWEFGWQPICYCGSAMDKEDIKLRGVQLDARRRDELMRVLLSN